MITIYLLVNKDRYKSCKRGNETFLSYNRLKIRVYTYFKVVNVKKHRIQTSNSLKKEFLNEQFYNLIRFNTCKRLYK